MGWKKTKNTKVKTDEPTAFVDIGGYVHQDAGKAKVKMYVGDVNKPLVVDDASVTKRLKRLRVSMNVTEDKTPSQNCVYEKNVWMEQKEQDDGSSNGKESGPVQLSESEISPGDLAEDPKGGLTVPKVLKNMIDNLENKTTVQWVVIGAALVLGAVALGLAVMG